MPDRQLTKFAVQAGQPIQVPMFYAKTFTIQASANDFTIVLHDTLPMAGDDGISSSEELTRPVVILKLSPQSAKDCASALTSAVRQYEETYRTTLVTDADAEGLKYEEMYPKLATNADTERLK